MRLDHLLSREPCCGAALAVGPRAPPCAGGGGWWWCGAWGRVGSAGGVLVGRVLVVGLGMGALLLWADGRAVGFTSNTRGPPFGGAALLPWWGVVAPSLGGGPPPVLVGGVLGSALLPGSFLRWGLWWLWWVVCDLYSGCEHLCCLRASPLLVLSCVRRGVCGGACGPRGRRFVVVVVGVFLLCVVLWGIRWMPWHQELMKDVAACDMPRGVGERALIRGCPNGGTRPGLCWATII